MATIRLPPDFREFLLLLNSKNVEYLLIGGYAIAYHGYPRATGDIDLWIAVNHKNAERLVAVVEEFGFISPELSLATFLEEGPIIRMGIPPFRIELLTSVSGVDFETCYAQRTSDVIDGVRIDILSLEDLKLNKLASGRAKDINDLENLP